MLCAVNSPVFAMADAQGNVSNRSIKQMLEKGGDWHFVGQAPLHEHLLLWTAIDTVACLLDDYFIQNANGNINDVATPLEVAIRNRLENDLNEENEPDILPYLADVRGRAIEAASNCGDRFQLDGEGYRYLQVQLKGEHANSIPGFLLTRTGLLSTRRSQDDGHPLKDWLSKVKGAWFTPAAEPHGSACPSCMMAGMAHLRKTFSGYGRGATAGTWKSNTQFFPVTNDIADTLIRGAIAWGLYKYSDLLYGGVDPWRDPSYLNLFLKGDVSTPFRYIRHLRSWTAWGLWVHWSPNEHGDACSICGQTGHTMQAVSVDHPGRGVEGGSEEEEDKEASEDTGSSEPGKKIWPKVPKTTPTKVTYVHEKIPSPFTLTQDKDGGIEFPKLTQLASYTDIILNNEKGSGYNPPTSVSDVFTPMHDVGCFQWHMSQDEGTLTYTEIPLGQWMDANAKQNVRKVAKIVQDAQKALGAARIKGLDPIDSTPILSTWIQGVANPDGWKKNIYRSMLNRIERQIQHVRDPAVRAKAYSEFHKKMYPPKKGKK